MDDPIFAGVPPDPGGDGAHGVFLQLMFPMVLILAFLVVTEVSSLQRALDQLERELEGTETGRLKDQRDVALLLVQEQLVVKAAAEVMEGEAGSIGLSDYAAVVPAPGHIAARDVNVRFRAISTALASRFNGAELARTRGRLRELVLQRYRAFVDDLLRESPQLALSGDASLLRLSEKSEAALERELGGHIDRLVAQAVETQTALLLVWISSPQAKQMVGADSAVLWGDIQDGRADVLSEEFIKLEARHLRERLAEIGAPLLDATVNGIL